MAARSSLGTTLQHTVVDRTHLVGMVALVGVRTSIVEREFATNEQRALMVGSGKWSTESGTRFAIVHIGIGKKDRCLGTEALTHMHAFAHERTIHLGTIGHCCTFGNYRTFENHVWTDERW